MLLKDLWSFLFFGIRSFDEISKEPELMSKCMELCQILSNDMEKEKIKVKMALPVIRIV